MSRPRLYLNRDAGLDWLIALEFGCVDDGTPADCCERIGEAFAYIRDEPGGRVLGFRVDRFSRFDAEADEHEAIWSGPRFDAPLLGLTDASAGEVIVGARAFFGDQSSINRLMFHTAIAAKDDREEALGHWLACLGAGDSMAHFAVGYTLYELERYAGAYRHLRHYTEIAPHCSWAWCWYGYACEAIGEPAEARRAYERALALEAEGADETNAAERLAALDAS